MQEYHAMLDKLEKEQEQAFKKTKLTYKIRKGLSDNHETIPGISYAEYMTNKLNDQRPFDRPHGRQERTRYRNGKTQDWTYLKETAKDWIQSGCEVFEYDHNSKLVKITNSKKSTRQKYAIAMEGIKLEYYRA